MNCSHQEEHKSKNYLLRTLSIIIAIIVTGGWGGYYRYHLCWKYIEWRYDLKNVEKIPNSIMPETAIPGGWVEYSLGYMSFYLPAEASLVDKINNTAVFHYGDTNIIIGLSPLIPEVIQLLESASQVYPTQNTHLTLPQLRLESFSAGANDFHWSMSPKDIQWHIFVISIRSLINIDDLKFTESLSRKDLEGVLFFNERSASLDWQCPVGINGGYIHFVAMEKEQKLDLKIIRGISQSIKVNCCPCPLTTSSP